MRSLGPILVSLALVVAMGVAHGVFSDRWVRSAQLEQALVGLQRVPTTIGDWVGEDRPLSEEVMKAGGIDGAIVRRFRNERTGETVTMLIVCGRGGPISVHTPDVCYEGAGYRQLAPEKPQKVDAGDGRVETFNVARFGMPGGLDPTQMEIFWAWSTDGVSWQAPENPRMVLARSRALYKMYVVRTFFPKSKEDSAKTIENFLLRTLPELRQTLPSTAN